MAVDHLLQSTAEILQPLLAGKRELRLQQIRVALRGGQMMIKHPFLQGCERIDILHVGYTACYRTDDVIDLLLRQFDQGEHGGADMHR
ncbi:hypothetical protein [Xanthomonas melonis]|uniref:hypothetical protein n=1 Tax=Xanthomonas melonis TaxID=56456 RepID=UPI001E4AC7BF|nr:hypothetical protein [Xanthomonas melonis]